MPTDRDSILDGDAVATKRDGPGERGWARLSKGTLVDRYVVLEEIGAGGMGVVYAAYDPELDRKIAIKLLQHGVITNDKAWLLREAQALARLSHPNVIAVHDVGSLPDDRVFVAMELVEGVTLRTWLERAPRRWREVLPVLRSAGAGLAAAHRAGLVHRDFKPDNVLVGEDGRVRVLDFGLARPRRDTDPPMPRDSDRTIEASSPLHATLTEAGAILGTPAYMAPELYSSTGADARSDQFAFGVALFEALYRMRPFDRGDTGSEPKQPPDVGVPPRIRATVLRAIAADPAARFATMDALLAELALDPAARRRRAIAAVAGIIALGVTIAVGVASRSSGQVAPTLASATIAVAPIAIDMPRYGREPPQPAAVADALAQLLGQVSGVRLVGMPAASADLAAARATTAEYVARGAIRDDRGTLRAEIELVSAATGQPVAVIRTQRPFPGLASLLDAVAVELARQIAPHAAVDLAPSPSRAQPFYREGIQALDTGTFTEARQFLEQAVDADPNFADAWYSLALARSWTEAGGHLQGDAIDTAARLVPPGPKRELVLAVGEYADQRWTDARHRLDRLAAASTDDGPRLRDVYYYLGETNWHDGRHDAGFRYFQRALELDRHFRPATVHMWQYLVSRRDPDAARYVALADEPEGWADFALGRYAALAETGTTPFALWARLVLGRPMTPEQAAWLAGDAIDARVLRIAIALGHGDEVAARTEVAALWRVYVADRDPQQLPVATYHGLELLAEVVIAAELRPEARQVVTFLAAQRKPAPTRAYERLTILAAPLLHDTSLIEREHLPERSRRILDATEAESAGHRAEAATIWAELVADPTFEWNYPERAALARDLAALGPTRERERRALCADTLRPAVFRPAWLVLRRACGGDR